MHVHHVSQSANLLVELIDACKIGGNREGRIGFTSDSHRRLQRSISLPCERRVGGHDTQRPCER